MFVLIENATRQDALNLILACVFFSDVGNPSYGQGTLVGVPLLSKQTADPKTEWSAVLESRASNENANNVSNTVLHVSVSILFFWSSRIKRQNLIKALVYLFSVLKISCI